MSKTTKIAYKPETVDPLQKPQYLVIEDHHPFTLSDAMSQVSKASSFKEYLKIGIVD